MDPATVTVRGYATVPARADEVHVTIQVRAVEASPETALNVVADRSRLLEALCDELRIAPDARVTSGATVQEQYEYERDRTRLVGYAAAHTTLLRLPDTQPLPALLREATARARARIAGPVWRIAPDNPARLEACRQAASEARRKAEAYAQALGVKLGGLVKISEPDGDHQAAPMQARLAVASAPGPSAELPVQSGDLDVSACVEVTFAVEPG